MLCASEFMVSTKERRVYGPKCSTLVCKNGKISKINVRSKIVVHGQNMQDD